MACHIQPVSPFPISTTNCCFYEGKSHLFYQLQRSTVYSVLPITISTKITLATSVLNLATGHSSIHPVTVGKQHAACIISAECRHCCNTTTANYHRHCNLKGNTMLATRKPCCRKETARCCKCSFRSKFANIPYKYKTSRASKATLQSSKHAGAKHNLTQNRDSKSIKVTCLESVKKQ